jgi:hypothetical protein
MVFLSVPFTSYHFLAFNLTSNYYVLISSQLVPYCFPEITRLLVSRNFPLVHLSFCGLQRSYLQDN